MNRIVLSIFFSLLLCGCFDGKSVVPDEKMQTFRLNANIEAATHDTRAQVESTGRFNWTEDDLIGICGYKCSNNRFHYVSDVTSDNMFEGMFDASTDSIWFGYFPYKKDVVINDNILFFTIEEESDFRNDVNSAPMLGFMNGKNTMYFKQAGGLLHLSFKGFRSDMFRIVVESTGLSRHFLSGTAVISIDSADNPSFSFISGSCRRVFNMSFIDKDMAIYDLFVPLTAGYYSTLSVSVLNENGDYILSRTISDNTVERAKLIDVPLLDCSE